MQALVYERFGGPGVLQIKQIARPADPVEWQLLVRVRSASLNPVDAEQRKGPTHALLSYPWPQVSQSFRTGLRVLFGRSKGVLNLLECMRR